MRLIPRWRVPHIHDEWHCERMDRLHALLDQWQRELDLGLWHLEYELVVYGENHARPGRHRGAELQHGELEEIGCRALDRCVHGDSFGGGATTLVVRQDVG